MHVGHRASRRHLYLQRPLDGARRPLQRGRLRDARPRDRGLAPDADRAVIDAGSKALTSDLLGFCRLRHRGRLSGGGHHLDLSEEHGVIDLSACAGPRPEIGDKIRIIPNHTCVVSNLFDRWSFTAMAS